MSDDPQLNRGLEGERQTFAPDRADAYLVGVCGEHLAFILMARSGVREVYSVLGTINHYSKHDREYDVSLAEALLPGVLADPLTVCEGAKGELLFFGGYSDQHYLVVPVKVLPEELWLSTMFIGNRKRLGKRYDRRGRVLYKKNG